MSECVDMFTLTKTSRNEMIEEVKKYAKQKNRNVSAIIENYLKMLKTMNIEKQIGGCTKFWF